jgi:site-specific DNA-cytosine methylase
MTEDMDETNAFHFVRNYDIPIIKPSQWNNDDYLSSLKNEYDLLFANPPCSGLSAINRNASADNDINKHIYEVANTINIIEPKTFLIENAPTLITKGAPILKDIQRILSDKYRITVITDLAGNHNVPMFRKRTLVVG